MKHLLVGLDAAAADAQPYARVLEAFGDEVKATFVAGGAFESALPEAEVVVTQRLTDDQIAHATRLQWLASWAAGLESMSATTLVDRGVIVTNSSGVHGPNIAEHVMGMMLMFDRRLDVYLRSQLAGRWNRELKSRGEGAEELTGQTLLVVGLGRIGEALARRAKAFEMKVFGVKRSPTHRHGDRDTVDRVVGLDALDGVLPEADHVVLALPLTVETRHLFDAARLARMKPTARLYNVGRGALIDEAALATALADRRIAGAGLDVFEQEPLPPTSPLWALDNVLLTPHVSGVTPHYYERAAAIFGRNLRKFLDGTTLDNRFDPARGY